VSEVIKLLEEQLKAHDLHFARKPILIGGMAMEYYGIRKSGADIDLVISNEDYESLAQKYPDNRKDIWGDLGVVIEPFEIWRCIALFDYEFFLKNAIDEGIAFVVSLDRLLLMRVAAMRVPKYMNDLNLIWQYYCNNFINQDFYQYREHHLASYEDSGGTIFGGRYTDG
jgi:hypothetical protein